MLLEHCKAGKTRGPKPNEPFKKAPFFASDNSMPCDGRGMLVFLKLPDFVMAVGTVVRYGDIFLGCSDSSSCLTFTGASSVLPCSCSCTGFWSMVYLIQLPGYCRFVLRHLCVWWARVAKAVAKIAATPTSASNVTSHVGSQRLYGGVGRCVRSSKDIFHLLCVTEM